jgi:hypothetical protein
MVTLRNILIPPSLSLSVITHIAVTVDVLYGEARLDKRFPNVGSVHVVPNFGFEINAMQRICEGP